MITGRRILLIGTLAIAPVVLAPEVGDASAVATVVQGKQAQIDVNRNQINPCTGAIGDLVDNERDSWTVVTRRDGSTLLRGHSVARVTFLPHDPDAESYAGEEVFIDVEPTNGGSDVVHVSQQFRLHGTNGGTIAFRQIVRVVMSPAGFVRFDRESTTLTCG